MTRNARINSGGFLFGANLIATVVVLFIVFCCVGFVWQKKQIAVLSATMRACELKHAALRANNEKMRRQLASLLSPVALDARSRELNLGLALPDPSRIWRLPEPAAIEAASSEYPQKQYAAGRSGAPAIP